MSTGADIPIPLKVEGQAEVLAALTRIADALDKTGKAATDAAPKVDQIGRALGGFSGVVRGFNEAHEAVSRLIGSIGAAADQITALASEQERLSANSERLGLDFDAGAAAAGRFADETEAMTAATRLAASGIHLTQAELNSLMRIAGSTSQALGIGVAEAAERLTQGLLSGSRNALRPFGHDLEEIATRSHSVGERIAEMTRVAERTPQAMDSASDSVNRFRDSIEDATRTMATSFAAEIRRLDGVGRPFNRATADADEFNRSLQAIGETAAHLISGIPAVLQTVTGVLQVAGGHAMRPAEIIMRMFGVNASSAGTVIRAGQQNLDEGTNRLEGLTSDLYDDRTAAGDRTTDPARLSAAQRAAAASAAAQRARDEARVRNAHSSGGGGGDAHHASDREREAAEIANEIALLQGLTKGQAINRPQWLTADGNSEIRSLQIRRANLLEAEASIRRRGETENEHAVRLAETLRQTTETIQGLIREDDVERRRLDEKSRAHADRNAAYRRAAGDDALTDRKPDDEDTMENILRRRANRVEADERADARSDEGIADRARKDVATRREERELDRRYQANLGFTERMEELSHRRLNAAQEEAEFVVGAFNAMGRAFSDHLTAFIEGREELGTALQGMLSDTLKAISQEAAVKAGLNLAEGFAALATYRYDAAGEHFAAAGIYTAVAGLAGVGAAVTAPSTPGASTGQGRAANDNARSATPMSGGAGGSVGATVINVAFNGPQYGTGGVVQAAREIVGVINRGAVQGAVQINHLALGGAR